MAILRWHSLHQAILERELAFLPLYKDYKNTNRYCPNDTGKTHIGEIKWLDLIIITVEDLK